MSDVGSHDATSHYSSPWDRFWFTPMAVQPVARIRGALCIIAIAYFISCWADIAFWYTDGGPLSAARVSTFLQTSGLDDAARWIVSPLFLTSSLWVYRAYLIVSIAVALAVAAGRGGRVAPWLLWGLFVGWANRAMLLSSLTETMLSLGLFAAAIARPQAMYRPKDEKGLITWTSGLAQRLLAVQVTIVGAATFITMLAGRVWHNGLGAFALAAPVQDRTINWTQNPLMTSAIGQELLTHALVIALPMGLFLAWLPRTNSLGKAMLVAWCVVIAMLGSYWLYAATLATMVLAIRPVK